MKKIIYTDRSNANVKFILSSIRSSEPLTTEQEYDLWQRMSCGSEKAREQLIFANLRYVITIAKKYIASKASLDDLIQSGNEGLVRAVDKFDASLGYRFISYATWYIENEVRKTAYGYLRNKCVSLDKPLGTDDDSPTRKDYLCARPCQSTDWNLRYRDALERLKRHAEERQYGLGRLTAELHQMLLEGYTTSDFARRHRLTESQMNRLLTILREEADGSLHIAA
jgi:RNA polymerase sigma factor (sigma-70 family)